MQLDLHLYIHGFLTTDQILFSLCGWLNPWMGNPGIQKVSPYTYLWICIKGPMQFKTVLSKSQFYIWIYIYIFMYEDIFKVGRSQNISASWDFLVELRSEIGRLSLGWFREGLEIWIKSSKMGKFQTSTEISFIGLARNVYALLPFSFWHKS